MHYIVKRADRASRPVAVGQSLYRGRDYYGVADTDSNMTGIEHVSVAETEAGEPFFTIPHEDVSIVR